MPHDPNQPRKKHPAEVAFENAQEAITAADPETALRSFEEALANGGMIAARGEFLDQLLGLGEAGMVLLVKYRDIAEQHLELGIGNLHVERSRWMAFNERLGNESSAEAFYKRMQSQGVGKVAQRMAAVWSVVKMHNANGSYSAAKSYAEDCAETLKVYAEKPELLRELAKAGLATSPLLRVAGACGRAAVGMKDRELFGRLAVMAMTARTVDGYFAFEQEAGENVEMIGWLKEVARELKTPVQIELAIGQALAEADPENLIAIGAPKDEYAHEARKLAEKLKDQLTSGVTREEVSAALREVWIQAFGNIATVDKDGNRSESRLNPSYKLPNLDDAVEKILAAIG